MTQALMLRLARFSAACGARLSWLAMLPMLPRRRSSITDNGWWSDLCARNAAQDARFARFRRGLRHRIIVEASPFWEAREHMARLLRQTPHHAALFDRFRTLDRIGAPPTADFAPHGRFAPNTVRYMRYLSDCETRFGNLDGATIAEIGVGFGGQCKIFFDRFAIDRYVLIDLPGPLLLARRVLEAALGPETVARRISFCIAGSDGVAAGMPAGGVDLALSTLAFSECDRAIQRGYIDTVLAHAASGYLHRNEISDKFGVASMSMADLEAALPAKLEIEKDDITYWYDRTDIVTWSGSAAAAH